jgi:hypothetical protein
MRQSLTPLFYRAAFLFRTTHAATEIGRDSQFSPVTLIILRQNRSSGNRMTTRRHRAIALISETAPIATRTSVRPSFGTMPRGDRNVLGGYFHEEVNHGHAPTRTIDSNNNKLQVVTQVLGSALIALSGESNGSRR